MNTVDKARRAAMDSLLEFGHHADSKIDAVSRDSATADYLRSVIRDGDVAYLVEIFSENQDGHLLKWFSLLAQAIEYRAGKDSCELGEYTGDMIGGYLDAEIERVIDELPTLEELHADDYDEDYHRELRATA